MAYLSVGGVSESLRVAAVFLTSGAVLCIIYDFLRLLRALIIKGRLWIFIIDILFSVLASFLLYSAFIVLNNGMVRAHLLLCSAAGFWIWRLTIGKLLFAPVSRVFAFVFSLTARLSERLAAISVQTARHIRQIGSSITSKLSNIFGKDVKKDLQPPKV